MKQELADKLYQKYPEIFSGRHNDTNPIHYGIAVLDGWYNIIDTAFFAIQQHINSRNGSVSQVVAIQIKEKFGTLRLYCDGGDEYISGIIRYAEIISAVICEVCGAPGKVCNDDGFYKCRCKPCLDVEVVARQQELFEHTLTELAFAEDDETSQEDLDDGDNDG